MDVIVVADGYEVDGYRLVAIMQSHMGVVADGFESLWITLAAGTPPLIFTLPNY